MSVTHHKTTIAGETYFGDKIALDLTVKEMAHSIKKYLSEHEVNLQVAISEAFENFDAMQVVGLQVHRMIEDAVKEKVLAELDFAIRDAMSSVEVRRRLCTVAVAAMIKKLEGIEE